MSDKVQVRFEFRMRDGFAEVTTVVDLGDDLMERHGPYGLTELADVDAIVAFAVKNIRSTALAFLAKTGEPVCEEQVDE